MRTRPQIIDALIEATEYHDTEIILNIDHIRDLFNDAIGHLKDTSRVVRDNQRLRRHIKQLKYDNAQQARCIENLTDKLNATNDSLPRWIIVEERLPERGITKCSACVKCGDGLKRVVCASYNAELKLWTGWHGEKIGNEITHWMPLPEPPKEE